eukprot:4009275-Pleurochrysis_carterae.AAC.1
MAPCVASLAAVAAARDSDVLKRTRSVAVAAGDSGLPETMRTGRPCGIRKGVRGGRRSCRRREARRYARACARAMASAVAMESADGSVRNHANAPRSGANRVDKWIEVHSGARAYADKCSA